MFNKVNYDPKTAFDVHFPSAKLRPVGSLLPKRGIPRLILGHRYGTAMKLPAQIYKYLGVVTASKKNAMFLWTGVSRPQRSSCVCFVPQLSYLLTTYEVDLVLRHDDNMVQNIAVQ